MPTATALPAPGPANASSAADVVFAVCSCTVAMLSRAAGRWVHRAGGALGNKVPLGGLENKERKMPKTKGALALTGLGRVLINESWVRGGAPMSAFGGRADGDQRPPERPLIAISGHSKGTRPILGGVRLDDEKPGQMGSRTRSNRKRRSIRWLPRECSSLGGWFEVRFPRTWSLSGKCRLGLGGREL